MLAPAPGIRAALGSDRVHEYNAETGAIVINPAEVKSHVVWPCMRKNVVVALTPASLQDLALQEFDSADAELRPPVLGTVDPVALRLAQMLAIELTQREVPSELYVDSLVTLFGVHVLRNYGSGKTSLPIPAGGFSRQTARRVQEYLEANFTRKLSVAELAAVSGLSPRRFIEVFAKTFGEPPHRHVLRLRLEYAERLLARGDLPIAEVAHLSGFSSQSHLTTTLVKHRGMTPMQVRRR